MSLGGVISMGNLSFYKHTIVTKIYSFKVIAEKPKSGHLPVLKNAALNSDIDFD